MVLLLHFKQTGVENRTADQTKGFPASPLSARLVVVATVTQLVGGAQSCPILDLPSSLCGGKTMTFATTEHIATWKSLVLSLERECQKKIKLLLRLPSSYSLLREKKKKKVNSIHGINSGPVSCCSKGWVDFCVHVTGLLSIFRENSLVKHSVACDEAFCSHVLWNNTTLGFLVIQPVVRSPLDSTF